MFVSEKDNENKMINKSYAYIHQDTAETHAENIYGIVHKHVFAHVCAHINIYINSLTCMHAYTYI